MGDPQVTIGFNTKSWSSMTTGWFWVPPWLREPSYLYPVMTVRISALEGPLMLVTITQSWIINIYISHYVSPFDHCPYLITVEIWATMHELWKHITMNEPLIILIYHHEWTIYMLYIYMYISYIYTYIHIIWSYESLSSHHEFPRHRPRLAAGVELRPRRRCRHGVFAIGVLRLTVGHNGPQRASFRGLKLEGVQIIILKKKTGMCISFIPNSYSGF